MLFVYQGMRRSMDTPTDRRDLQESEMPVPMANATPGAFNVRKSTRGFAHDLGGLMEVLKSLSRHITRTAVVSEGLSHRSEGVLPALQHAVLIAKCNLHLFFF